MAIRISSKKNRFKPEFEAIFFAYSLLLTAYCYLIIGVGRLTTNIPGKTETEGIVKSSICL